MIRPVQDYGLPTARYSKRYVEFQCDCGNCFSTMWTNFANGTAKSCGRCKIFSWKESGQTKFFLLEMTTPMEKVQKLTDKVEWRCECGKASTAPVIQVMAGIKKSCGCIRNAAISAAVRQVQRKEVKGKEDWRREMPELVLDKSSPESWSAGSSKRFRFRCKCGKEFLRKMTKYVPGKSNCGRCDEIRISHGDAFHGFSYAGHEIALKRSSDQRALFKCRCGRTEPLRAREVLGGLRKTCGKCSLVTIGTDQRFGKLRPEGSIELKKSSGRKTRWVCDCGLSCEIGFYSVLSGRTRSCGRCKSTIDQWWIDNREALRALTYPVLKTNPVLAALQPLDDVLGPRIPFRTVCPVCKRVHSTVMDSVRTGHCLTCGCTAVHTSQAQIDIQAFIESMGVNAVLEYEVGGLKYDVFVPSGNLLIEYHGLKWHSVPEARTRDREKYRTAVRGGFRFTCIYEDEWAFRRGRVEAFLRNLVRANRPMSLRPSQCTIIRTTAQVADAFYEDNHYIGPCKSSMNLGVEFKGMLIACMSFKRPTRQTSRYDWELVRMASHPDYRVHGVWSKLLKQFISGNSPKSIVSFSDNRLFNGGVYEKLGFIHDGNVPSDYYWTKNKHRFHKSGLRKPPGEKRTETEIRTMEGYRRIWDLGKKRWVLKLSV